MSKKVRVIIVALLVQSITLCLCYIVRVIQETVGWNILSPYHILGTISGAVWFWAFQLQEKEG